MYEHLPIIGWLWKRLLKNRTFFLTFGDWKYQLINSREVKLRSKPHPGRRSRRCFGPWRFDSGPTIKIVPINGEWPKKHTQIVGIYQCMVIYHHLNGDLNGDLSSFEIRMVRRPILLGAFRCWSWDPKHFFIHLHHWMPRFEGPLGFFPSMSHPNAPKMFRDIYVETQGPRRNRGLWMWGMLHIGRDYIWTHLEMLMISHIWRSDPSNQTKQSGSIWIYLAWPEFEISWVSNST